jgi:L-fuculose-phosphate aldolase
MTSETQAKTTVIEAGNRLFNEGMVARTWGNVSVRLDQNRCVITPSGIPYEKLTIDNIVTVSIEDLSYTGSVKPSSEKGLHAAIYRQHPDIHAVIHTHQPVASAFSAARKPITGVTGDIAELIGPHVQTAAYALPGTKKLAQAGADALKHSKDMEEAFLVCLALENLCQSRVEMAAMAVAGVSSVEPGLIHRTYLEKYARGSHP